MKIVFFGTSENSVILLEGIARYFEVAGIVTAPDSPVGRKQRLTPSLVAQFAAQADSLKNIPLLKPDRLKNLSFIKSLESLNADLFIVLSYGKILPSEIITIPPLKTLNVHPSLLPLYRGPTPMQTALLDGAATTGNTIIVMDEEMDHGPILAQREIAIGENETYPQLEQKLALDSVDLLMKTIPPYANGELKPSEQNHSRATYTSMIKKGDGRINWARPAKEIYNQYRAYVRRPGVWTTWNGEVFKILECYPAFGSHPAPAGTVLANHNAVVCGDGSLLEIKTVQRAGKKPTDVKSFLNGNKTFADTVLQ